MVHPAMVDPNDATKATVPVSCLPSKDEDKEALTKFESNLKVKHVFEWFPTQIHGWMAARYGINPLFRSLHLLTP